MTTTKQQKTAAGMVAFLMAFSLLAASACEAPPPAKAARDYAPLIAQIADTNTAKMAAADQAARAAELEALKAYEQADFDAMRGVVYEPEPQK